MNLTTKEIVEQVFDVKIENITQEELNAFVESLKKAEQKGEFELEGVEM